LAHRGLPYGHGQRVWTTSSIRAGMLGIKPGLGGVLQIGVTPSRGHMAGRYGGLGFEAESSKTGIKIGSAASSPESFSRHFYMAKGGLVDERMLAILAQLHGLDVGGDQGRLRINGKVLDSGGWLMPGEAGVNLGRKPERVIGPGERFPTADEIGDAIVRALRRDGAIQPVVSVTDMDARVRRYQSNRGQRPTGFR
jgi:hypothetical protein